MQSRFTFTCCSKWNHGNGRPLVPESLWVVRIPSHITVSLTGSPLEQGCSLIFLIGNKNTWERDLDSFQSQGNHFSNRRSHFHNCQTGRVRVSKRYLGCQYTCRYFYLYIHCLSDFAGGSGLYVRYNLEMFLPWYIAFYNPRQSRTKIPESWTTAFC